MPSAEIPVRCRVVVVPVRDGQPARVYIDIPNAKVGSLVLWYATYTVDLAATYRVANPERMPRRHLRLLREVARIELHLCHDEAAASEVGCGVRHEQSVRSLADDPGEGVLADPLDEFRPAEEPESTTVGGLVEEEPGAFLRRGHTQRPRAGLAVPNGRLLPGASKQGRFHHHQEDRAPRLLAIQKSTITPAR